MEDETQKIIDEQFKSLPKPVQEAITSAKMDEQLRGLEKKYGLHVDQWAKLENQIMLAVLGLADVENMANDIAKEIGIPTELANTIVDDVAVTIFKPIRDELERNLEHPDAKAETESDVDATRTQILADAAAERTTAPAPAVTLSPVGATPPPEPPAEKAVRAPVSENYKSGEASTQRKAVHDDPYREPPL